MRAVDAAADGAGGAADDEDDEDDARRIERRLRCQSFEKVRYALLLKQKSGGIASFPNATVFGRDAAVVCRYYSAPTTPLPSHGTREPPDYRTLSQEQLLTELCNFFVINADERAAAMRATAVWRAYTFNADNLLKMMIVHVRLSATVPVIVSGETGCSKTSLVKFLAFAKGCLTPTSRCSTCTRASRRRASASSSPNASGSRSSPAARSVASSTRSTPRSTSGS